MVATEAAGIQMSRKTKFRRAEKSSDGATRAGLPAGVDFGGEENGVHPVGAAGRELRTPADSLQLPVWTPAGS